MTILTSVTVHTRFGAPPRDALRDLSCEISGPGSGPPPSPSSSWSVPFPAPGNVVTAHRLEESRVLPSSAHPGSVGLAMVRFLRSAPVHPPPNCERRFLSGSSLKINSGVSPSIRYPRHVRDTNRTNLVGSYAAMPIYISATPHYFLSEISP